MSRRVVNKNAKLERLQRIWRLRYEQRLTLRAIGEQENISAGRVRQILGWGKRYFERRVLDYTPKTSLDPDGIELAWFVLDNQLERAHERLQSRVSDN
jgi:hypothetical protein